MPNTASSAGAGDVLGNVRRTGLGNFALSFGNPFNTITFTAGIAPADVAVNLVKAKPSGAMGFPNAVNRTYTITPNAGSGFTATLRLHYIDAELNGNNESLLQLWRFNGTVWQREDRTNFDTTANWVEKNNVTQFSPWTFNSNVPTAAPASISGQVTKGEGTPLGGVLVTLTGGPQVRRVITNAAGTYSFTNVDTDGFYTITPGRANYFFAPANRSFALLGNRTDAVFTAVAAAFPNANPLDTPEFFVRQQYLDFLSREPEQGGFEYWSAQINQCLSESRLVGIAQFVDAILETVRRGAGVTFDSGQSDSFINDVNTGGRALMMRNLTDTQAFAHAPAVYNRAFVLMEYFAYLRRDPDQDGYDFWVNVMNREPGNYRGMVCAFVTSAEYQRRFSSVVTNSNAECAP